MNDLLELIESKFLPYVEKPVRYIGSELNIIKKQLTNVNLHGVLCFPDLYDIGMSHFGLQILYHIVNKMPQWALSRCFNPWIDAEKLMRDLGIPLYTLEYFSPVRDADWIGFSVQYELQFTNVVNMLDLAGVSVLSSERKEHEPIVVAGGPCVGNPEPLASFIDAFALGDGEETIVKICTVLENAKKSGDSRQQKLIKLSSIPGVYVPSLVQMEKRGSFVVPADQNRITKAAKIPVLDQQYYPERPVVPLIEVVHTRLAVEVMRGCTRGCRFCSAGMYYRPLRERSSQDIIDQIRTGIAATGLCEIGLLSLSTADYSCINELLASAQQLKKNSHISLGLPSTRIDALNDQQLDLYQSVTSTSSLTIAPEAGSMRLRKVINKDFTDEKIYETVNRLLERNVQTLKLYFMVGLPTETQEDIESIISMVTTISGMVRARSKRRMIHVAISPFSPKAHTPFGREAMASVEVLLERSIYIKRSLRGLKNVKVSYRDPDMTLLETVMARGDRAVGQLIFNAWKDGARFDGWDECFSIERWFNAAGMLGIDLSIYLGKYPESMKLPWAGVSTGISEQFLEIEAQRAMKEEPTHDCRIHGCSGCGVCADEIQNRLQSEKEFKVEAVQKQSIKNDVSTTANSYCYRFIYYKGKPLRFLGHLDMVSLFHRAFSMAEVKLAYSNGFNPHPKISFGPPLPFGVSGEREAFDIVTTEPFGSKVEAINELLPNELKILEFYPLAGLEQSLNSSIVSAHYNFQVPLNSLDPEIGSKITQLLAEKHLEIVFQKKGETIHKDIRPGIIELVPENGGKGFNAVLSLVPGMSCKPSELASILYPELAFADFAVTRKRYFVKTAGNSVIPL